MNWNADFIFLPCAKLTMCLILQCYLNDNSVYRIKKGDIILNDKKQKYSFEKH